MTIIRRLLMGIVIFGLGYAFAQTYPNQPIRVIVPYPAGGTTDSIARVLTPEMSNSLRQPIVIDNVPGVAGALGRQRAWEARADGYTLLIDRIQPDRGGGRVVALVGSVGYVLVVRRTASWRTLSAFTSAARGRLDSVSLANTGDGSDSERIGAAIRSQFSLGVRQIPFPGEAASLDALQTDQVDAAIVSIPAARSLVESGKIVAIAVTTRQRNTLLPHVPTLAEQGMPGASFGTAYAIYAPTATPREITTTIERAATSAMRNADAQRRLSVLGVGLGPNQEGSNADPVCPQDKKWCSCTKECIRKGDTCPTRC